MTGAGNEIFEQIKSYLPSYLTPENKAELFSELKKFPNNFNYYLCPHKETYLQGDAWRGFVAINFHTQESKMVSGVIISNSCDITPENPSTKERLFVLNQFGFYLFLIKLSIHFTRFQEDVNRTAN